MLQLDPVGGVDGWNWCWLTVLDWWALPERNGAISFLFAKTIHCNEHGGANRLSLLY
jgi:hypothetical protein